MSVYIHTYIPKYKDVFGMYVCVIYRSIYTYIHA